MSLDTIVAEQATRKLAPEDYITYALSRHEHVYNNTRQGLIKLADMAKLPLAETAVVLKALEIEGYVDSSTGFWRLVKPTERVAAVLA